MHVYYLSPLLDLVTETILRWDTTEAQDTVTRPGWSIATIQYWCWRGTDWTFPCLQYLNGVHLDVCYHDMKTHQYSETKVMHFLFGLLRIRGLYMFRALLAHPQEALKYNSWYNACVLCQLAGPGLKWNWSSISILMQATDITRTQYTKCCMCNASWGWASSARNT
jgi:hypothetical protein